MQDNLYTEKQILNKEYFEYTRNDVIDFLKEYISKNPKELNTVLEIGCGTGQTGKQLKNTFNIQKYIGVELMKEPALKAKIHLDEVYNNNIEDMCRENNFLGIEQRKYDIVLCLDVLEHLYDPWKVLAEIRKWMNPDALLICSIPNAGNIYVIKKLFQDKFQYEIRGLLDKTHIRFFTLHTIKQLLIETNFKFIKYKDNNELHIPKLKLYNYLTFGRFKKLFIFQYIVLAKLS